MKAGNVVQDFSLSLCTRVNGVTCPVYLVGDAVVGSLHLDVLQHFPLTRKFVQVIDSLFIYWCVSCSFVLLT